MTKMYSFFVASLRAKIKKEFLERHFFKKKQIFVCDQKLCDGKYQRIGYQVWGYNACIERDASYDTI